MLVLMYTAAAILTTLQESDSRDYLWKLIGARMDGSTKISYYYKYMLGIYIARHQSFP